MCDGRGGGAGWGHCQVALAGFVVQAAYSRLVVIMIVRVYTDDVRERGWRAAAGARGSACVKQPAASLISILSCCILYLPPAGRGAWCWLIGCW